MDVLIRLTLCFILGVCIYKAASRALISKRILKIYKCIECMVDEREAALLDNNNPKKLLEAVGGYINPKTLLNIVNLFKKIVWIFKIKRYNEYDFAELLGRFKIIIMVHKYIIEILKDDLLKNKLYSMDSSYINSRLISDIISKTDGEPDPLVIYSKESIVLCNMLRIPKDKIGFGFYTNNIDFIMNKCGGINLKDYDIITDKEWKIFYKIANSIKISYDESTLNELASKYINFRPKDIVSNNSNFRFVLYSDDCIYTHFSLNDEAEKIIYFISTNKSENGKRICYNLNENNMNMLIHDVANAYPLMFYDFQASITTIISLLFYKK